MEEHPLVISARERLPEKTSLSPPQNISNEDVFSLLSRWKVEREKYPGWIVAPKAKRNTIWHYTTGWSNKLVQHVETWTAADRILVYKELNWRLEVSMVPLFPEQIDPFKKAVSELVEMFESSRSPIVSKEFQKTKLVSNSDVLPAWFEIAFSLLREARENYNDEYWCELEQKIAIMLNLDKQFKDRFEHERAIKAVWNVERDEAMRILSKWQPTPDKPLAVIWKAALLAELNELNESRDLLLAALNSIRQSEQVRGQDISLFSLEGWCTFLLEAVERASDVGRKTDREFTERWKELETWYCNPWAVFESLKTEVLISTPKMPGKSTRVRHFDPGRESIKYELFGSIDQFLPAFAYIRFFEQAGVPLTIEQLNIAGEELKIACQHIAPFIGFWSPALLVRAKMVKTLGEDQEFLGRTQVANMDVNLAMRLHSWCLKIWNGEVSRLEASVSISRDSDSLLSCLAEILSRLAFKVDTEQLELGFRTAISIYPWVGHPVHQITGATEDWFNRLYEAADSELLLDWLPALISAPLYQRIGISQVEWSDALQKFPSERISNTAVDDEKKKRINQAIDSLIRKSSGETGSIRARALFRFLKLNEADLLEKKHLGKVVTLLWKERDQSGLPSIPGLCWDSYQNLPNPPRSDVAELLKESILEKSVFEGGSIILNLDGSVGISSGRQPVADFIRLSAKNTVSPFYVLGESKGEIIWNDDEAVALFRKSLEWWQKAKVALEKKDFIFGEINRQKMGEQLAEFLIRVVLPKYSVLGKQDRITLQDWLEELRENQVYVSPVFPYLLAIKSEMASQFQEQIANDLKGAEVDAVASAANTIRHFELLYSEKMVEASPIDVTTLLLERVAFRRQAGLTHCLRRVMQLIIQLPDAINDHQLALLNSGLDAWLEVSSIDPQSHWEIDESDCPLFRRQLGILAGVIFARQESRGEPLHEAILEWRANCLRDPMPEIRRSFEEGKSWFVEIETNKT